MVKEKVIFSNESPFCVSFKKSWCHSKKEWRGTESKVFAVHCEFSKNSRRSHLLMFFPRFMIWNPHSTHFMVLSVDQLHRDTDFNFQQDLVPAHTDTISNVIPLWMVSVCWLIRMMNYQRSTLTVWLKCICRLILYLCGKICSQT